MSADPIGSALGFAGFAWPVALTLAVVAVRERRYAKRRRALNERLHELRRPLQALALASRPDPARGPDPVELALIALRDLDAELNGGRPELCRRPVEARMLAIAAVERWRARVGRAGRRIEVRWSGGDALANVDPLRVAQALDNLIANALEHGSGRITVEGSLRDRSVELAVRDGAACGHPRLRDGNSGRDPRHGHGLSITRALARGNGGDLLMRVGRRHTVVALTLPLA